jgi:di/tricarboxylate transporter
MRVLQLRILVVTIATSLAAVFASGVELFPAYARVLLSVEVILLPTIYVLGNLLIEEQLRAEYDHKLRKIHGELVTIGRKYYKNGLLQR